MNFEFATAGRIVFGNGALQQVAPAVRGLGSKPLIVTGSAPERARVLFDALDYAGIPYSVYASAGEPTVDAALAGVAQARADACDLIIGFGGGSALDAAKAIAALVANPGDPFDYLEVIGKALPLPNAPLPCIAIPTTAGTGSEVTRNAVLASPAHGVKVSVRSPLMLPRLAIVDPILTYSTPAAVTAYTGLDALTQLLEPFVSPKATPITDAICREALPLAARALPRVYANGQDAEAREQMAFASLCGGLALANAGLGAVHGFAGPFGGMFDAAHGAICAALLAPVCAANLTALRTREPASPALLRYAEAARLCLADAYATADDLVTWLAELCATLNVPGLATYGMTSDAIATLVAKSAASSSMKANPIVLTNEELAVIVRAAL